MDISSLHLPGTNPYFVTLSRVLLPSETFFNARTGNDTGMEEFQLLGGFMGVGKPGVGRTPGFAQEGPRRGLIRSAGIVPFWSTVLVTRRR